MKLCACVLRPASPQRGSAAFDELHGQFMSMLLRVMAGQLEASVYEDQCRSLLGTGSYELFTLDKLSTKIVKHLQASRLFSSMTGMLRVEGGGTGGLT